MKKLTMIVSCYNEGEVLPLFYDETSKVLKGLDSKYDYELLFVDDGSGDDTLKKIMSFAEKDEKVKYISFSRNFGKESAMYAGLKMSEGDYVGLIDADLQHSPELIPDMLKAVDEEGYDVAASRRTDRKGEGGIKSFLSSQFYKVINKISDTYIDDGAQDFRIMSRKVVDAILEMTEKVRFTKGIFSWVGFNTKWFAHENRERAAGTSKWSLRKLIKYAGDGILGFTTKPLKWPIYLGLISLILALAELIVIICLSVGGTISVLNHLILLSVLLIGGVTLVSIGVGGMYLARTYTETQNRPVFIVSKTNIEKNND